MDGNDGGQSVLLIVASPVSKLLLYRIGDPTRLGDERTGAYLVVCLVSENVESYVGDEM